MAEYRDTALRSKAAIIKEMALCLGSKSFCPSIICSNRLFHGPISSAMGTGGLLCLRAGDFGIILHVSFFTFWKIDLRVFYRRCDVKNG